MHKLHDNLIEYVINQMQSEPTTEYEGLRCQEKQYEKQIRDKYQQHLNLFYTHSSDILHLSVVKRQNNQICYDSLVAKNGYEKFDVVAEVRGAVIKYHKLQELVSTKTVNKEQLPLLIYLNAQQKYLMAPKNITSVIFNHPTYRKSIGNHQENRSCNCYLERHFDLKMFITANRDIQPGQQLLLQQKSFDNFVYHIPPSP